MAGLAAVAGRERRLQDKPVVPALLHLGLVLLLDGQDALALLDQLHSAVGDEPDGQGAHGETWSREGDTVTQLWLLAQQGQCSTSTAASQVSLGGLLRVNAVWVLVQEENRPVGIC